jgi:hypothetical protein
MDAAAGPVDADTKTYLLSRTRGREGDIGGRQAHRFTAYDTYTMRARESEVIDASVFGAFEFVVREEPRRRRAKRKQRAELHTHMDMAKHPDDILNVLGEVHHAASNAMQLDTLSFADTQSL